MATVLMASNDHQNADESLRLANHDNSLPIRRSSGRRKDGNKGCDPSAGRQQKQKTPQRGMGIEKLERVITMQERLKKMNGISQGFGLPPVAAPFSDTPDFIVSGSPVPLQLPKLGGWILAPANVAAPVELIQNHGSEGRSMGFHGGQMGVGGFGHDQLRTDLLGVGCLNHLEFLGKNISIVNGISRELSSTPNVVAKCFSEHCNICHKKKRVNGENSGTGGLLRSDMNNNNVGDWGFLGLHCRDNQNIINQENHVNETLVVPRVERVGNAKQGVQVVAVHRKGSSNAEGGSVLMEYEFFPSRKGPNNSQKDDESVMMKQMQLDSYSSSSMDMMPMAAGIILDHGHGSTSSTGIDLSLKLSYH